MRFKEIIGQHELKARLIAAVREERISHAQLFLGPEGSGALPLAIAYAQYISCEQPADNDSCGTCPSCIKYNKLIHPDLHFSYPIVGSKELSVNFLPQWRSALLGNPYLSTQAWLQTLEAENKQGNIGVDECRDIIRRLSLKAFEGGYKVLIMWMPEYLGKEGNTLLKLIEEPPANTLLLLVAENPDELLVTITSRTQLVKVKRLSDADLAQALEERHQQQKETALNIAHLAEGNYNRALQLLDADQDNDYSQSFIIWMRKCFMLNGFKQDVIAELIAWIDEMPKWGREKQKNFLHAGLHLIRECMLINFATPDLVRLSGKNLEEYTKFAAFINLANAEQIIGALSDATYHIERNAHPKALFMDLSIKMNRLLKMK